MHRVNTMDGKSFVLFDTEEEKATPSILYSGTHLDSKMDIWI